jgi:hypothetical protein
MKVVPVTIGALAPTKLTFTFFILCEPTTSVVLRQTTG